MRSKARIALWVLVLTAALALLGGVSAVVLARKAPGFRSGYVLYVDEDRDAAAALDSLCSAGRARYPRLLGAAFRRRNVEELIRPGRYVVRPQQSCAEVANMLVLGWQTPGRLTLSGTLRSKDKLAQVISAQLMMDSLTVRSLLDSAAFLEPYGFTPQDVFSLILPDTYEVYWTVSPEELFARFRREYDLFWTEERLEKARRQHLTPREVSILASIVTGETNRADEYPKIASVYLTRLSRRMKLQACPTVCFLYDYKIRRVLKEHTANPSPYNTYRHAGLPPGPIAVPPKACIDAVLDPAPEHYLYFSASPAFDGTNRFARTYAEHLKNAREYHRAFKARNNPT